MTQILNEYSDLVRLVSRASTSYLLLGSGVGLQYANPDLAISETIRFIQQDAVGDILILFGGDHADESKPDLGFLIQEVKHQLTPRVCVLAVQSWQSYDPFVDYLLRYPRTFTDDSHSKELWGGVIRGVPVAATQYYLSHEVQAQLRAVICVGGGAIAQQEFSYSIETGMTQHHYIRAEARYPKGDLLYGFVDEWYHAQHVSKHHELST